MTTLALPKINLGANQWTGLWRFYTTPDGVPLSRYELDLINEGVPRSLPEAMASDLASAIIGRTVRVHTRKNVITTAGRAQVNKAISGQISALSEVALTHEQLGTGTSAPSAADTNLETPAAGTKQAISSVSYSGGQLNITSFWAAGDAEGSWTEYGAFMNTTILFAHVGIDITVGAGDALTIDGTVTQSN